MHSLTKYPRKSPDTASRIIGSEAIVVTPAEGLARVLNGTGSFVWQSLDGKNSITDIVNVLLSEFEITPQQARDEVLDFLKELERKKMVEICDEPAV